jgi:trehalose 6-phosphate synthase
VALHEAFQTYKGPWFGWSGKVSAHSAAQPKIIHKELVQYAVVDLTSLDRQEYYNGFANRALWPIMHYRMCRQSAMPTTLGAASYRNLAPSTAG